MSFSERPKDIEVDIAKADPRMEQLLRKRQEFAADSLTWGKFASWAYLANEAQVRKESEGPDLSPESAEAMSDFVHQWTNFVADFTRSMIDPSFKMINGGSPSAAQLFDDFEDNFTFNAISVLGLQSVVSRFGKPFVAERLRTLLEGGARGVSIGERAVVQNIKNSSEADPEGLEYHSKKLADLELFLAQLS